MALSLYGPAQPGSDLRGVAGRRSGGTTLPPSFQQGSVNGQKHLIATALEDLADAADEQGFSAPAIVVIGEVVEQRILDAHPCQPR